MRRIALAAAACALGVGCFVVDVSKLESFGCADGGCPTGQSCCDGVCRSGGCTGACAADTPCTSNPGAPCKQGTTVCGTGASCADLGNAPAGTDCGGGRLCDGQGSCVACEAGAACSTNAGAPCRAGVLECGVSGSRCVDAAPLDAGRSCGTALVCDGAGACVACADGTTCGTNPGAPCRQGVVRCGSGAPVCADGAPASTTTPCDAGSCDGVGNCGACVPGRQCVGNPTACTAGVTECDGGVARCVDGAPLDAGTLCGGGTCDGDGGCAVACAASQRCDVPGAPCLRGATACDGGSSCEVQGPVPEGSLCDDGGVCGVDGGCGACVAGAPCATNPSPCRPGVLVCGATPTCVDGPALPPGTPCGVNQVCAADGGCIGCPTGAPCSANPTFCRLGVVSCTTGSARCVDGVARDAGLSCDAGAVCASTGTCTPCTADAGCATNPNPCRVGVTSCAQGPLCLDTTPRAPGTSCGVNLVCNAAATCVSCAVDAGCSTNPTACLVGRTTSCATGPACADTPTARPAGTSCGAAAVCAGDGGCNPCDAGVVCTTNPGSACRFGATSCATGTTTCADSTPRDAGLACGTNLVCNTTGSCVSCTPAGACTGNPTPCRNGALTCGTGPVCTDGVGFRAAGTSCGTNQVCAPDGGCAACVPGAVCTTNPGAPCIAGLISCTTGVPTCLNSVPMPLDFACDAGAVCDGAGACVPCTGACQRLAFFADAGTFSWTVPAGVTRVDVAAWAGGGAGGIQQNATGGGSAFVATSLAVDAGEVIDVWIAQGGAYPGNGGGASYVRRGVTNLVIVGGGGGGGNDGCGGCVDGGRGGGGGAPIGEAGASVTGASVQCTLATGGRGGTTTAGGDGGIATGSATFICSGQPGQAHIGGRSSGTSVCDPLPGASTWRMGGGQANGGGGGGGAGAFGGGGAGFIYTHCAGGGGGGSSLATGTSTTMEAGVGPVQGNAAASSGAGAGGARLRSGSPGRVELRY